MVELVEDKVGFTFILLSRVLAHLTGNPLENIRFNFNMDKNFKIITKFITSNFQINFLAVSLNSYDDPVFYSLPVNWRFGFSANNIQIID